MKQQGRLECEGEWEPGQWFQSLYGMDLEGFVRDWLHGYPKLRYRWVEGAAVVYLPEPQR